MEGEASEYWYVQKTKISMSGDVCYVRGCASDPVEINVEHNYEFRGMRHDEHDALGLVLGVPIVGAEQTGADEPTVGAETAGSDERYVPVVYRALLSNCFQNPYIIIDA